MIFYGPQNTTSKCDTSFSFGILISLKRARNFVLEVNESSDSVLLLSGKKFDCWSILNWLYLRVSLILTNLLNGWRIIWLMNQSFNLLVELWPTCALVENLLVEIHWQGHKKTSSSNPSQLLKKSTASIFFSGKGLEDEWIFVSLPKCFTRSLLTQFVQPLRIHYYAMNKYSEVKSDLWRNCDMIKSKVEVGHQRPSSSSQGKQASHLIAWGDQSSVCPSIEGSRDVATFIGSPISGTAAAAIPI